MNFMNAPDGSTFVIGMPIVYFFSICAIKATDYQKKYVERLLIIIGLILLLLYYYCVFSGNTTLSHIGTIGILIYYVSTFIACKLLY